MANYNNNKKNGNEISYTHFSVSVPRKDAALGEKVAVVEGFCKGVRVRTVQGNQGAIKVADVLVSAVIPDSQVKYHFGEEIVNAQYHSVLFKVSLWGMAAENAEKYPPQMNQRIIMMVDRMSVNSFDKRDGSKAYTIDCHGCDNFIKTTSARKEDGVTALKESDGNGGNASNGNASNGGAARGGAPAQSNSFNAGANRIPNFSEIGDEDGDLPF